MNTAIIVAAGSGSRFASSHSKQFVPLLGKPLIIRTLESFEACAAIDEIVLVLPAEGLDQFLSLGTGHDLKKLKSIVIGGDTRTGSVRNGLAAIDGSVANVVAVHDGARPLVSPDEITRTVLTAAETGAACLVAEVTDTIKEVDDTHIVCTIDRRKLRRALTPQAFRYDVISRALDASDVDESATDECSLVEKLGIEITFVEGSGRNIKVTRPEDLILAEALFRDLKT
jgi:2-C-methyl-D-erythritol 4-phosphate cytidylyltransferase